MRAHGVFAHAPERRASAAAASSVINLVGCADASELGTFKSARRARTKPGMSVGSYEQSAASTNSASRANMEDVEARSQSNSRTEHVPARIDAGASSASNVTSMAATVTLFAPRSIAA